MSRYRSAFYQPLLSDWSNFGRWTESGGKDATRRAREIAGTVLAEFEPPRLDPAISDALDDYRARRLRDGGAAPDT
jgi:trimethylamine--corrinoid protein Co-methyltransferase